MSGPTDAFGLKSLSRPSLVRRLIWLAGLWGLISLVVAGATLSAFFVRSSLSRVDSSLSDRLDDLYAGATVEQGEVIAPALTDQSALRAYSGHYWEIAQPSGPRVWQALVRSRSLWDGELKPPTVGRFAPGERMAYDSVGPKNEPVRVSARIVQLQGYPRPVVFLTAEDRSTLDADARHFAETTVLALVVLGSGLIFGVILQVRVGLRPLFRLQKDVADVRKGKADSVALDYPEELTPLARELNALLTHNQEVVERQRTHVGNLAHALKTPLSVMMAEAEQRPDNPLSQVVLRQTQTMREQVDHHLRRARAAARAQGSGERTPIAPALDELARTLERVFMDRRIAIEWDADESLAFRGERQDLLELIGNVLENACKWCRRRVRVIAVADDPGFLRLVVEDDGPGLPLDQREAVLRRGARLDETAPGSGLGLSIVEDLAKAYGGSIRLGESALGGLKAELRLPQAEA